MIKNLGMFKNLADTPVTQFDQIVFGQKLLRNSTLHDENREKCEPIQGSLSAVLKWNTPKTTCLLHRLSFFRKLRRYKSAATTRSAGPSSSISNVLACRSRGCGFQCGRDKPYSHAPSSVRNVAVGEIIRSSTLRRSWFVTLNSIQSIKTRSYFSRTKGPAVHLFGCVAISISRTVLFYFTLHMNNISRQW